jgi:hypothetical protein
MNRSKNQNTLHMDLEIVGPAMVTWQVRREPRGFRSEENRRDGWISTAGTSVFRHPSFWPVRRGSDSAALLTGFECRWPEVVLVNPLEPLIWREISAPGCAIAVVFGFPFLSSPWGVELGLASSRSSSGLVLGLSFLSSLLLGYGGE